MAKEAKKNEGPSCACGRVDLYMESLKQKDASQKDLIGSSTLNQEDNDDSDVHSSGKKDQKHDQN